MDQEGNSLEVTTADGATIDLAPLVEAPRADLATARDMINRAIDGDNAGLYTALTMLNRALKAMCPHGPRAWITPRDRPGKGHWTMCPRCNVTWRDQDGGAKI